MKPWFIYLAQARTGRLYVGITSDPEKRIKTHNSGRGSKFAIEQGPFKLVYVSSPFENKSEARKRELQVKKWSFEKKMNLVSGKWS